MNADADTRPPASPPPGSATPEQDGWLKSALSLDVSTYADKAAGEAPSGGGFIADAVGALVAGAKKLLAGKPPVPRTELGPAQTARADKLMKGMPPEDQTKVQALLDKAKPDEKKYLEKALASKHSAAELDTFYKAIEGKNAAWMEKNLHVVGESSGAGIKQQWRDSCGPTTIQAMKAELDPVYALKLRTENPDLTKADDDDPAKPNAKAAAEQKEVLERHGGKAVARSSTEKDPNEDYGMGLDDALADTKDTTGLKFDRKPVNDTTMDASLTEFDASAKNGLPMPLRLGNEDGGHFVLLTGADPGPPRRYSIHDPWDGKTITVTDKQLKTHDFKIAGYDTVTHMYKPEPEPDPAAPAAPSPAPTPAPVS